MTDITQGNHFIKIPLTIFISPEFSEIMRCLSISRVEAVGRFVLFLDFLYKRPNKPIRASYIDEQFGKGFCKALIKIGWGKQNKFSFLFVPPKNLECRPPKSRSGKAITNRCERDIRGRFLKSKFGRKRVDIIRSDAEGNLVFGFVLRNEANSDSKPTEHQDPPINTLDHYNI